MNHKIILEFTDKLSDSFILPLGMKAEVISAAPKWKSRSDLTTDFIQTWNKHVEEKISEMKVDYTINELKSLKVKQLKEICNEKQISIKGNKTEIINRLMNPSLFQQSPALEMITEYLEVLKDKYPCYNIDVKEHLKLYSLEKSPKKTKKAQAESDSKSMRLYTLEQLKKLSKPKLVELCPKDLNINFKGSKQSIIEAIQKNKCSFLSGDIQGQIRDRRPILHIRRNNYGNYEHLDTGYIFDEITHHVIGKQVGKTVEQLHPEDIEVLNELNFKYKLPVNFD